MILWQIGALGVTTFHLQDLWNADGLAILVEVLRRHYPPRHPVVIYETTHFPVIDPLIQRTTLDGIPGCRINTHSALWVPPIGKAPLDTAMAQRLGLSIPR